MRDTSYLERLELLEKQSAALGTARNAGLDIGMAEERFQQNILGFASELGYESIDVLESEVEEKFTALDGLLNSGLFDESTTQAQREALSSTPEARLLEISKAAGLTVSVAEVEKSEVTSTLEDGDELEEQATEESEDDTTLTDEQETTVVVQPESQQEKPVIHASFSGEGLQRAILFSRNPESKASNRKSAIPLISDQSITRAENPKMIALTREYALNVLLKGDTFRGRDIIHEIRDFLSEQGIPEDSIAKLNFTTMAGHWMSRLRYNHQSIVINIAKEKSSPHYALNPNLTILFETSDPKTTTTDVEAENTSSEIKETDKEEDDTASETLQDTVRYYTGLIVGAIETRERLLNALQVPTLDSDTIAKINEFLEEKGQNLSRQTPESVLQERRKAIRTFRAAYTDEELFAQVIDAMDGPLGEFAGYLLDEFSENEQWEKLIYYLSCEMKTQSKNLPGGRTELTIYKVREEDIIGQVTGNYYEIVQYGQYRPQLLERGFTSTNGTSPIMPEEDTEIEAMHEVTTTTGETHEQVAATIITVPSIADSQKRKGFVLSRAEVIEEPSKDTARPAIAAASKEIKSEKRPDWLVAAGQEAKDFLDKIIEKAKQLGIEEPEKLLADEGLTAQQIFKLINDNATSAVKTLHVAREAGLLKIRDDFDKSETPIDLADVLMLSSMKGRKPGKGVTNAKRLKNLRRYVETQIVAPFVQAHRK